MPALHDKHRPTKFEQVIGQDAVVKSIQNRVKRKDGGQAFLFSGPAGVGKTTLARITARALGVNPTGFVEVDAATFTGVDDMRTIKATLDYRAFGDSGMRGIILDEAHRLSAQAWDALLKAVEEPPAHVLWFFCTTNVGKVPATIKTRCTAYTLKPLQDKTLGQLYDSVCDAEKIELRGDIGDFIIERADGSARQLLSFIDVCRTAQTKREAADLLQAAVETDQTIALCRLLASGKSSWPKCMEIVSKLADEPAEGVRIIVCNYMAKCIIGAKDDKTAAHFLSVLDAFCVPYQPAERQAPLLLSIGRVLLNG